MSMEKYYSWGFKSCSKDIKRMEAVRKARGGKTKIKEILKSLLERETDLRVFFTSHIWTYTI